MCQERRLIYRCIFGNFNIEMLFKTTKLVEVTKRVNTEESCGTPVFIDKVEEMGSNQKGELKSGHRGWWRTD